MSRLLSCLTLVGACSGGVVFGQSLTVQQPTFESFSVGTTVSVPDRGTLGLGGVGRSAGGRSSTGGWPRQGGYGRTSSASSMSASVFIHDFESMDAAVLNAANGSEPRPTFTKSRYSDATSYAMTRRHERFERQPIATGPREAAGPDRVKEPPRRSESTLYDDADRLLALGEAAERRGARGVAAIHYRTAAKAGSAEARRRLEGLGPAAKVVVEAR